jgi:hypothetical protein
MHSVIVEGTACIGEMQPFMMDIEERKAHFFFHVFDRLAQSRLRYEELLRCLRIIAKIRNLNEIVQLSYIHAV